MGEAARPGATPRARRRRCIARTSSRTSTSRNPDVAADVAGRDGRRRAAARAAIDDPAIKDALKREVEAAIARGVFGSPFVIVDGEPFWGLDRFDQLERWLATGGF